MQGPESEGSDGGGCDHRLGRRSALGAAARGAGAGHAGAVDLHRAEGRVAAGPAVRRRVADVQPHHRAEVARWVPRGAHDGGSVGLLARARIDARSFRTGSHTRKTMPPRSVLSTSIVPPWISRIERASWRPSPRPP